MFLTNETPETLYKTLTEIIPKAIETDAFDDDYQTDFVHPSNTDILLNLIEDTERLKSHLIHQSNLPFRQKLYSKRM